MTPVGPLPSHLLPPSSDTCLGVMNDLAEWECQGEAELSCYIYTRNPVSYPFTQHLRHQGFCSRCCEDLERDDIVQGTAYSKT